MPADIKVPQLGESITEAEILAWRVADGDAVAVDQIILELETDKTTVELPAPAAGVVRIGKPQGSVVAVGEVIGRIEEGAGKAPAAKAAPATRPAPGPKAAPAPAPAAAAAPAPPAPPAPPPPAAPAAAPRMGPAARRVAEEKGVDAAQVHGTGPGGRATKSDVEAAAARAAAAPPSPSPSQAPAPAAPPIEGDDVVRTRMTRLRRTIADRLVSAQHTAAILTTFNEVDMSAAMALRARHKERFEKVHGTSLGLMSIFARACVLALGDVPIVGAQIDGDDIVTRKGVHLGIAASTDRGLVVPVVRNADRMGLADLERKIARLAGLAREGRLGVEDLAGGTFTISNGGVFGSLLSTPILNPPQSGILGMHKIEKRPVVVDDQVVIRPMMYVALSYDHRLVDGKEAVTFLVRVKERVEDPSRLLLEI